MSQKVSAFSLPDGPVLAGVSLAEEVAPDVPDHKPTIPLDAQETRVTGIVILTVLAVIYTLYIGRDLLLPVVIAGVLNLLLQPFMRLLNSTLRLPMPLAALVVILVFLSLTITFGWLVSLPSRSWAEQAPAMIDAVQQRLSFLNTPIQSILSFLHSLENIGKGEPKGGTVAVAENNSLSGIVFFGTASTIAAFFTVIVILYFMLASGDRLLRGFIEVLPTFSDKRRAVEIAHEVQRNIAGYLTTVTLMNLAVGVATALAMWVAGLPDPALWGALAFFLNFIPIVGPIIALVAFLFLGLASLPMVFPAFLPAILFGIIHLAEGQIVTPMLVARRFELNPVLVMLSLLFWHAIWGIPGVLLAVPLLAILKILADRIEPLNKLGHLIAS